MLISVLILTAAVPIRADITPVEDLPPSLFWEKLEYLCDREEILSVSDAGVETGSSGAGLESLRLYCLQQTIPSFAIELEPARTERVDELARSQGLTFPDDLGGDEAEGFEPLLETTLQLAQQGETTQLGLSEEKTLTKAVELLCRDEKVSSALPGVCALTAETLSLDALRGELVQDLLGLVDRVIARAEDKGGEELRAARMALATVATFARARSSNELVVQLGEEATKLFACERGKECDPLVETASIGWSLMVSMALDRTDFLSAPEHYRRIVERDLRVALGRSDLELNEVQRNAVDRAVELLREGAESARRVPADAPEELVIWAVSFLEAIITAAGDLGFVAWTVRHEDDQFTVFAEKTMAHALDIVRLFRKLTDKDFFAALEREIWQLIEEPLAAAGFPEGLTTLVKIISATEPEEIKRRAIRALLGLGPWSDNWLFDINATVPRLESGDFAVTGDLMLGYAAERWGVMGRGAMAEYDLDTSTTYTDSRRYQGAVEGWLNLSLTPELDLEGRLAVDIAFYDSTHVIKRGERQGVIDEDSLLGRAGLLGGVKWLAHPRFVLGAWLGAGGQVDSLDHTTIDDNGTEHRSALHWDFQTQGRARAEWHLWPQILALRLWSNNRFFRRTVDELAIAVVRDVTVDQSVTTVFELDSGNRIHIDFEVIRFFGFVPAITLGVDLIYLKNNISNTLSIVWVAGVGIRRTSF